MERSLTKVKTWRVSADIRASIVSLEQQLPTPDGTERAVTAPWTHVGEGLGRPIGPSRRTSMIVGIDDERDGH